jgi:hypothetical protein
VIPFRAGPLAGDRQAVIDAFAPLGWWDYEEGCIGDAWAETAPR